MTLGELKQLVGERPFIWKWTSRHDVPPFISQFINETEIVYEKDGEFKVFNVATANDHEITNFELISYLEETVDLKCECGAESIGVGTHSHWCGKASVA